MFRQCIQRLAMITLSITVIAGLATIGGCSTETRYRYLSKIFEEVPTPGDEVQHKPVVHKPRRSRVADLAPAPVTVEAAPSSKLLIPSRDWHELLRQLPKDEAGGVYWNEALANNLIQPRSWLKTDTPNQPAFDLILELTPKGQPLFKVIFPHKTHTDWLTCANCHSDIFKMQRGANSITMDKIYAGEFCGRCHGKVAFAIPTGCPRCHVALVGSAGEK